LANYPYNQIMNPTIAYFSAEFSVADSLPIYAGGLGILAGDIVQESGAEDLNLHAFGLVYHEAFTMGDHDTRPITQRLQDEGFSLIQDVDNKPILIPVLFGGRTIDVQGWRRDYGPTSLTLFDTKVVSNSPEDQEITDRLYDSRPGVMLRQQLVLAFASIALLETLAISPDFYHLNEGHMAFVGLAAAVAHQAKNSGLKLLEAINQMRPKLVGTKHTILSGAGLTLSRQALAAELDDVLSGAGGDLDLIFELGGKPDGYFSTTKFLMSLTANQSGVSEIHVLSEKAVHPDSRLIATTNGVFAPRWRAANLDGVSRGIGDDELRSLHNVNRLKLLDYVQEQTGAILDPDRLTVVWARRMTSYKRPEFLVADLERIAALTHHATQPMQFIYAGTANPADSVGMELMNKIVAASKRADLTESFSYVPNYNPATARTLVQGADVWLNTPIRGKEACGTSGMKASLNGALQLSTSDGWVDEIDLNAIGWEIPEAALPSDLYDILEHQVAPLYYEDGAGWMKKVHANITLIEQEFTAKTMLKNYYKKLYK
jgi:starch phosphorylase